MTAYVLGLGLDALTLAATILTVVVIDDDAFSRIFGAVVHYNDEGEIVAGGGDAAEGVPSPGRRRATHADGADGVTGRGLPGHSVATARPTPRPLVDCDPSGRTIMALDSEVARSRLTESQDGGSGSGRIWASSTYRLLEET